MWKSSSRRLMRAVKHIKAELRIDQLLDLNSSIESIIALLMKDELSCLSRASLKMNFMIFRAWILVSSR